MPLQQINSWQSIPFLRLLIPFSAGIILADHFPISIYFLQKITVGILFVLILFQALPAHRKIPWMCWAGLLIQTLIVVLGLLAYQHQDLRKQKDWLGYQYHENDSIIAIIEEPPIEKKKSWKAVASIISVRHNEHWRKANSNILVYIRNKELARVIETGDKIKFQVPIQKISNDFKNTNFDFVRYCSLQQIYFQVYLPKNSSAQYCKAGFSLKYYLHKTRSHIIEIIRAAMPNKTVQSVAEALLIGYKEDLDRSLVQSYSNTGVVHIIAISGLHLAMIYGLLLYLLQPIGNKKWNNYIRTLIVLLILWGFSFITGGAAAILRSAVGFSFLLISKCLGYKNNTWNTIAASAFFLLCYNPFLLFDIGFQLSYAAVLGIVMCNDYIEAWFHFENKLLHMIWKLNSISLSAQVFTIPLVLYQFHQFPNLFLFTNFIVVPLSGIILYAELLLLVVSPIPFLLKWTGTITSFLIEQMNGIIERTSRLPYALTRNISISITETILLYLLISTVLIWLIHQHSKSLIAALCVIFLLVLSRWVAF